MNDPVKEEGSVNDERNLIEPKQEVDESWELKEPKVELIDEMDVKKEEIDEDEYQHIIPYEYRDYLDQHTEEKQPTNSRKRLAADSSISARDSINCLKCGKRVSLSYPASARSHALRHTNLKMYECPAIYCNYKHYGSSAIISHMKNNHKSCADPVRKNEMSDEDREILEDMIQECFPDLDEIKLRLQSVICQLCNRCVKDREEAKREHSNGHIDPRLFKCDDCTYSTNFFDCLSIHAYKKHSKVFESDDRKLQLIKEEMTIRRWNNMCFGDLSNDDPIETVEYPDPVAKKFVKTENCNYYCQVCQKGVDDRRNHALEHVGIMLYKCSVPDCRFQTKDQNAMIDHEVKIHDLLVAFSGKCRISLTTAQVVEIGKMFVQCFPESSKI